MNEDSDDKTDKKYIFEFSRKIIEIESQIDFIKLQLNKGGSRTTQLIPLVKVALIVLVCFSSQGSNFDFSGDKAIPLFDQITVAE